MLQTCVAAPIIVAAKTCVKSAPCIATCLACQCLLWCNMHVDLHLHAAMKMHTQCTPPRVSEGYLECLPMSQDLACTMCATHCMSVGHQSGDVELDLRGEPVRQLECPCQDLRSSKAPKRLGCARQRHAQHARHCSALALYPWARGAPHAARARIRLLVAHLQACAVAVGDSREISVQVTRFALSAAAPWAWAARCCAWGSGLLRWPRGRRWLPLARAA